jgi:hypothetical protein
MSSHNHHYETAGLIISYLLKICIISVIVISIYQQQLVYFFGSTFALLVSLIPTILKRSYQITLPLVLDILIVTSLLLHTGGVLLNAYHSIPFYDSLTHFVSAFLVAFLSFVMIYTLDSYWADLTMHKYAIAFLVVFFTIVMGVVWEFNEWIADLVFHTAQQWGYTDTIKDLLVNTLAGIIMAIIGLSMIKRGSFKGLTEDFSEQIYKKAIKKLQEKYEKNDVLHAVAKQDTTVALPSVVVCLVALLTILRIGDLVVDYYIPVPGYQLTTRFLLSVLFAFVSLIFIYILDQHWEGLSMNQYAMAFVVVISTISCGVIFEFVKWLNITGTYYVETNQVLMLNLTADTFAGIIIAIAGVYLIKSGYFGEMTRNLGRQINDSFTKRIIPLKRNFER